MFAQRTKKITTLAIIMIAFGVLEILTGLYFNQTYNVESTYIYLIAALDTLFIIGGILLLTMKKIAAMTTVLLLIADIIGRAYLIQAQVYPFVDLGPAVAMLLGTIIAGIFGLYLWMRLDEFS